MIKFEVGQVYYSDLTLDCVKKTDKTVSFKKLNGEIVRKSIKTSERGFEYASFESFNVRAYEVEKKVYKNEPIPTADNQDKFFNGVYLDPAVEF